MSFQVKLKKPEQTTAVVKELVYLLWQAAGRSVGMGFFQDRGPGLSKDEVFDHAFNERDYPGRLSRPGEIHMDYVTGRCIKTYIKFNTITGEVTISPNTPRATYQDWDRKYKTGEEAMRAALIEVGADIEEAKAVEYS